MDLNYHIFKKSTKSKNKTVHKWYYYWNDPVTGVMHQKVCKGCKTRVEAYAFVSTLPPLFVEEKITIAKIAEWMYIPGGQHMERMEKLELSKLTIPMIIDFLSEDYHSGSWKNNFLTVVSEVYAEAPFHDLPYILCSCAIQNAGFVSAKELQFRLVNFCSMKESWLLMDFTNQISFTGLIITSAVTVQTTL